MVAAMSTLGKVEDNPIFSDMDTWPTGISMLAYPPSELAEKETEWVSIEAAEGRVAAASLIPYPPGIPLLIKGERIMKSHTETLSTLIKAGARFQGAIRLAEKELFVLK